VNDSRGRYGLSSLSDGVGEICGHPGRYGRFHRRTVIDGDAQEVRLTLPNGVKRSAARRW
jgi:hypothetical protein